MEQTVSAPADGVVAELRAKAGTRSAPARSSRSSSRQRPRTEAEPHARRHGRAGGGPRRRVRRHPRPGRRARRGRLAHAHPRGRLDVGDQISHLAYFDEVTVQSAIDPEQFKAGVAQAEAEGGIDPDTIATRFRDRTGAQLLAWFDTARAELIGTFAGLDPRARLPWFGPAMSAASSLTARIMETWAHRQDIADALGVDPRADRPAAPRRAHRRRRPRVQLRRARPDGPAAPIRVELDGPDGSPWTWGPPDAADRVTGPALDFCLLVTQRRHRDDLALVIEGPAATEWMAIAQAFAGAAGTGRSPREASS